MKVRMLKEKFVSVDGFHLERWCKGFEYEARDSVGCRLINDGHAELVKDLEMESAMKAKLQIAGILTTKGIF